MAVLLLASGCADGAHPIAPPEVAAFSSADMQPLARYRARTQGSSAVAYAVIGPQGGRLDFRGFAIDVPRGAVRRATVFSIHVPIAPVVGSDRVVASFGPHGARFAVPVAIELPYTGTTLDGAGDPTIVWWDAGWVDMGATLTRDGRRLRTLTDHFSTYGTTDRGGGGAIVASGG